MLIYFTVLLSENIAACLSGRDFNSIPEAEYSLMANIAVLLKSSVCSLLKGARRGLRGSRPWLGHAKTHLCTAELCGARRGDRFRCCFQGSKWLQCHRVAHAQNWPIIKHHTTPTFGSPQISGWPTLLLTPGPVFRNELKAQNWQQLRTTYWCAPEQRLQEAHSSYMSTVAVKLFILPKVWEHVWGVYISDAVIA